MEFKREDTITLAKAVYEDAVSFHAGGDYADYYCCVFCMGSMTDTREQFKHGMDCPVLVAQDVLTGVL